MTLPSHNPNDFPVNPSSQDEDQPRIGPTRERLARYGEEPDSFQTDSGRQVTRCSAVDWLFSNYRISGEAYSAAYRLLSDWHHGGLSQHVTADLARDIVDNGGARDVFDAKRMAAARHYAEAIGFVGPVHSHPIHHMVEGDMSPVQYGKEMLHWKERGEASVAAKQRLIDALEVLATFYAPPPSGHVRREYAEMQPGARPVIK